MSAQILIGKIVKIPETLKDIGKIDISYNYHANEKGEFSLAIKVKEQRQIIFAEKNYYNEDGESDIVTSYVCAFDVSKLLERYKK
jgi:hypothetical protein